MQVRSSDGRPVGNVDKLEGNRIKLTEDGSTLEASISISALIP